MEGHYLFCKVTILWHDEDLNWEMLNLKLALIALAIKIKSAVTIAEGEYTKPLVCPSYLWYLTRC